MATVTSLPTKEKFDAFLKDAGDKLVVIDFFATWCGPCKVIGPKVLAMAEENTNVLFGKVDVDENEEVGEEYGISALPTFKFFKNGSPIEGAEVQGASEPKLREAIAKHK